VKVIDKSKGIRKNVDIVNVVQQSLSSIPSQKLEKSGKGGNENTGPKQGNAKESGRARASAKTSSGAMSSLGTGRPPTAPTGGH